MKLASRTPLPPQRPPRRKSKKGNNRGGGDNDGRNCLKMVKRKRMTGARTVCLTRSPSLFCFLLISSFSRSDASPDFLSHFY